jgi:hypothetical protein
MLQIMRANLEVIRALRLLIGATAAMPWTDAQEQRILDAIFVDPAVTWEDLWIGVSSTTPTDAGGNVTEPSGGAYARVAISTVAGGAPNLGAAAGTAPAEKSNSAIVAFAAATADWLSAANLTHFTVHNAATAGTVRGWGLLATAKPVLNGDTLSFQIGALDFRQGKGTAG